MTLTDPTVRPRAIRLVEYLEALRGLREQPIRDLADYRDRRWWAGDIPVHPACVVSPAGDEPWLRVSKAQVPAPPEVPELLAPYLESDVLNPERTPAFAPGFEQTLAGVPEEQEELRQALAGYVTGPWREWAGRARAAHQARELYEGLFELRQRLQRDSALIELVWGCGILSWNTGDERIVHPLITTQVQISFDADTGAISVVPEAMVQHHLEIDMLQGLGLSGFDLLVDARERFRAGPVGPFDPELRLQYEKLLAPLGHDAALVDAVVPPPPASAPKITATWVLMVRRRATMYRRFFTDLHDALDSGALEVAAPLVAVVADEPGQLERMSLEAEGESWRGTAERLLMPLPSNPEQEKVALRLAEHRGVTVQGPPGTGKTHTIANLICHLVGHGKRVLVTSQKEQALAVLRDKIPESVRDLSVAVLGSSSASIGQLEQSVRAIYENAVGLDRADARQRISELDTDLTEAQRETGRLRNRIAASVARERDSFTLGEVTHTPSTLGRWVAEQEARLGFIPDEIPVAAACPLGAAETADLFRLAQAVPVADRAAARLRLPLPAELPASAELATLLADLADVRDRLAGTESAIVDRLALERLTPEELSALTSAVEQAAQRLEQLEQPWLAAVRAELRNPSFGITWRAQLKAVSEGIEELAAGRNRLIGHRVELPGDDAGLQETPVPGKELLGQLTEIRDRLAQGRGVSKTFHRDLYRVREACRVDEEPPRTADDAELCLLEARSRRRRQETVRRWNDTVSRVGGPVLAAPADNPEYELAGPVANLRAASSWEDGEWRTLRGRLVKAGVRA
ncbi:MAG TPA: AAA domain-containing protein, partial [Trebonia sp.]